MLPGLRQRVHRADRVGQGEQLLAQLHGEVPQDEPARVPALPGVPDDIERECAGGRPEARREVIGFHEWNARKKRCVLFALMFKVIYFAVNKLGSIHAGWIRCS